METFSAVPGEFPTQRPVTRMFSVVCVWINGWVNNREAGDLRRYRAQYDVTVMLGTCCKKQTSDEEHHFDGLAQDCSNSMALPMELLQSCTKPSICSSSYWI